MSTNNFRPLDKAEKCLLGEMLKLPFRDSHTLAQQVESLLIRQRDETLFDLRQTGDDERAAEKTFGVPVQATYIDSDGVAVYIDLFVDENDRLVELELWKADGSPIRLPYTDAEIHIQPIDVKNRS